MPLKKNLKRLKGVSTPFFGISFDLTNSERDIIRNLLVFLEAKGVLFNPFQLEDPNWVIISIIQIKDNLTKVLQDLDEKSNLIYYIRPMRAACRKFANSHPNPNVASMVERAQFFASLGEVRGVFGIYLKDLCERFDIKIEEDLASIFPLDE